MGARSFWNSAQHLEHAAELLDCAGNLIELATERLLHSRQLSAYTRMEMITAARERIEYTKAQNAVSRLRGENYRRILRKFGG